jgi:hypothetical protein
MSGEVEGPEHRQHPSRVHGRACRRAGFEGRHETHPLTEGHVHLGGDQPGLLVSLPARLADLPRDQPAELVLARLGAVAEAAQQGGSRLETRSRPPDEGPPCPGHGVVHGSLVRDLEAAEQVAVVGG